MVWNLQPVGPRHKFDFPSHTLRPLVAAEREAYAEELSQDPTQHKLDFGKHKKKSLVWIRTHAPSYLAWMVRERVYDKRPQLKEALVSQNFFPASLLNIEDEKERCKRALSVIDFWQSGAKDKQTAMAMLSESDVDKKLVPCSPKVLPVLKHQKQPAVMLSQGRASSETPEAASSQQWCWARAGPVLKHQKQPAVMLSQGRASSETPEAASSDVEPGQGQFWNTRSSQQWCWARAGPVLKHQKQPAVMLSQGRASSETPEAASSDVEPGQGQFW